MFKKNRGVIVEEKDQINQKKKRQTTLWIMVLVVILVAAVSGVTILELRQGLYEERSYNAIRIMDKVNDNVGTVMSEYWNDVAFKANLFCAKKLGTKAAALDYLGKLMEMDTDSGNGQLVLIDDAGRCYTSDGRSFRWSESGLLGTGEKKILISTIAALQATEEKILFLMPLPQRQTIEESNYTHLCLIMNMSDMDDYFETADYGEKSALFLIHRDGTYLYKKTGNQQLNKIYNLISKLKNCNYHYRTTAERTTSDILNGVDGCSCVDVDGENYFVIYNVLDINDWVVVMFVPEDSISGNSSNFMREIIVAIAVMMGIVMVTVVGLLLINHHQSQKNQMAINKQLQRTVEAERSANESKTRFLSSMSHDIRTPMNAIVGMTTIAAKHNEDKEYVKDCLGKISLASNHLLTLINDILDISKIESGKMTLNPIVFSLSDSVSNMINIVRSQIKSKNQVFEVHIGKICHEYLLADEIRINQIFINILTNAVKYTPEGGAVTVSLREEELEDKANMVRLVYKVKDTGIGMSEEYMKTMYDSFSRATDSRMDKIQGTGLGLAICKQMVDLMGGTIDCKSAPGQGTEFTIQLELPTAEDKSDDLMLPPMRVLLVDDNEIFLETAGETFIEMGVEVDKAQSGKEAIRMAVDMHDKGRDYPVIIIDWRMPEMDGIETSKQIRKRLGEDVSIIMISAYDSSEIEQAAKAAGVNGFMSKPFFKSRVYQELNAHLKLDLETLENPEENVGDLAGLKLLVAEDNDLNWEIAQELLAMYDIKTERAENGQVCVDMLASGAGKYDLVLMDVQMPVMSGKEAAKKIRESKKSYMKNIPIIAMTADAFAEDIVACMEAGMNGHVSKPIDMNHLFTEIRTVLEKARM